MDLKGKSVLAFGLGVLGGGVATANWLMRQGAKVTISDLKSADALRPSLDKLEGSPVLHLGSQTKQDIDDNDIIVVNPGISIHNELVQYAIAQKKVVTNEAVLFFENCPCKIVGITGTRGKTTTTAWTAHLIGPHAIAVGNNPDHPYLYPTQPPLYSKGEEKEGYTWAVVEMPSFQLEFFNETVRQLDIAVLTNIYQDHLNRYASMEEYAETKKNLYRWQRPDQKLITEKDVTPEVVKLDLTGFEKQWGKHNLINVQMAALAAHYAGVSWNDIQSRIATLPQIKYRQEVVYQDENLIIINDTAATSPEGGVAALNRFGGTDTVLIAGGTDASLDFTEWNEVVEKLIPKNHRIFLSGSATKKMLPGNIYEILEECLNAALALNPKIILFSPAAKSFEKFKNEYDRGQQFNNLVRRAIK